MADKRIRSEITDTLAKDPVNQSKENQYDSILQIIEEQNEKIATMSKQNEDQLAKNKILEKKIAEANGDTSEQVKESKRKYGYNIDGSRRPEESFKYRYNCLMDDNKEKVVISTKTIGRPHNSKNTNTGKNTNIHNLEIQFHDGSKTEIDVLDYINQKFQYNEFVEDGDTKVVDGKKNYTFHTETFGTFTIAQDFIN